MRLHFTKIKHHDWPAAFVHCDSGALLLPGFEGRPFGGDTTESSCEGGGLHLADSAASGVVFAYRYILMIHLGAVHMHTRLFVGLPIWISVLQTLPDFNNFK